MLIYNLAFWIGFVGGFSCVVVAFVPLTSKVIDKVAEKIERYLAERK